MRSGWAIGARQSPASASTSGGSASARARSRATPATCSSKATTASSASSSSGGRQAQREVAVERAGLQQQVAGPVGGGGLRDLDERPDGGGGEQPRALADGVGVGAQRGRDGNDRQQRVRRGGERDGHRLLAARARQPQLALGARELVAQQRAQLCAALARGRGSAGVLERDRERLHAVERRARARPHGPACGRARGAPGECARAPRRRPRPCPDGSSTSASRRSATAC